MTNTKSTKRALLASVMAMLLCFTMLLGTTFAWFTDSVTSSDNKIVAGTLDVQLWMYTDTDAASDGMAAGYEDISESTSPIFGGENSIAATANNADTLWEPGKTQVAYLAIRNGGNLDLKYTVGLNVQDAGKNLYEVMKYDIVENADKTNPVTSWNGGDSVVLGTQSVSGDVELKVGQTHYFALVIHMDEEAGSEYMGGQVNFDLTVLATQLASESDSFGDQYDSGAYFDGQIGTPEELVAALSNKEIKEDTTFVLGADIDMTGVQLAPARIYYGAAVKFVGNGYTISNVELIAPSPMQNGMENIGMFYLDESASLTVSDLTVENATINGNSTEYSDAAVIVGYANGKTNVVLNNVDVINGNVKNTAGNAALFVGYAAGSTVTMTDCLAIGTVSGERTDKTGVFFGTINSGCNITLINCVNATGINDYGRKLGDAVVNGETVSATTVDTAEDLIAALANGGNVIMTGDVTYQGSVCAYGVADTVVNGGTLNGNGQTLSVISPAEPNSNGYYDYTALSTTGGTIENLNIDNGFRAVFLKNMTEDVYLKNMKIGGEGVGYAINTGSNTGEYSLIVTDSEIYGWTSFAQIESASFTNCVFGQGGYYTDIYGRVLRPYVNTTLTDCSFIEHMNLDLSQLAEGHKVTFENCTVNGQDVTADVFTPYSGDDSVYDTALFSVDLPSWANSINDCIVFN